jgi:archaellum biogenesis ATPase FlaH
VSKKTLNLLMAGTGVGKSLVLGHIAASMLSIGNNVLYITMEMAEEKIAERIDANLLDVDISQIENMGKAKFDNKINALKAKTTGRLIIKEYPTASAHVGHFRALLDELKMKKDFIPDIIFIDYLNICASSRMKNTGDSYTYVKSIAEEVRGLAVEKNVPIWTATQTNRSGFGDSDPDITNISESFGLSATVDLMLALVSNEELDSLDQIMWKQLKNRYNDLNKPRRFVTVIDKSRMRVFDAEEEAQDDIMPALNEFSAKPQQTSDFSDFNFGG